MPKRLSFVKISEKSFIMTTTPINSEIVKSKIEESGLKSVGKASIRELVKLVDQIEQSSGDKFIRMEMGVPGFAS